MSVKEVVPPSSPCSSKDLKCNDENDDPLKNYVIPKRCSKKMIPPTVKTELINNAEFIASQISPPKVYYPPHVTRS